MIIQINKDSCVPNKIGVRYFHLVTRYREDEISGYVYDEISDPKCPVSLLGMNPDIELGSRDPVFYTNGPNYVKSHEHAEEIE